MSEWTATTLGEFAPFNYGKGLKESERVQTGAYPVFGSGGIVGNHIEPLVSGPTSVIGRKGSVGTINFAANGCWPIDTTFYVQDAPEREARFVYYLLQTLRLNEMNSDSAVPGLNRGSAESVPVLIPSLSEQKAIAGVLGALDDKIESNRRLIETAEELGRLELETALAGPDELGWQYSWPDAPLESVLDVIETGRRPKGGVARYSEGIPSIGAESIVSAGRFDFAKTKYVPEEFFESMNSGRLKSGDVLLYKDGGTPGNFIPHVSMAQDGFPFEDAAINEHVYRLRIKPPFSQAYLYYWLSSQRMLDEMWLRGTGAAIPGLNSSNVKELPIACPDEQLLTSVLQQVDILISRVFAAAKESRSLQLLRDSLVPELLSGRIRVRDAESLVEGAA